MPLTVQEWDLILRRDWQTSYPVVWEKARELLDKLPEGEELTTTELVEQLYPDNLARGDGILLRQKMFKALRAAVKHAHLPGYHHEGPTMKYRGKYITPPRWHRKDPNAEEPGTVECPCCGTRFVPEGGGV